MAYTPNNPYIPGDPYSYDLKWLVAQLKSITNTISGLDAAISSAVIKALDQHDPVYYETAQDLIESAQNVDSIAYIEGYHSAGDGGANLYYITGDYNDIIGASFYLTLTGVNKWALPIILTPYVTPEMFGAKGDGETNDDGPLHVLFNAAYTLKKDIFSENEKKYIFTNSLSIAGEVNIDIRGQLVYTGSGKAVILGSTTPPTDQPYFSDKKINISVSKRTDLIDWNDSEIGINFVNVMQAHIECGASNFGQGVRFEGSGYDCTYNIVNIKTLYNNKKGLVIASSNGGACNQNTFIGGRIGTWANSDSFLPAGELAYPIYFEDGANTTLNNNVFLNVSCEYGQSKSNSAIRINGDYCSLINCRFENIGAIDFSGSNYSYLIGGYGFQTGITLTMPVTCNYSVNYNNRFAHITSVATGVSDTIFNAINTANNEVFKIDNFGAMSVTNGGSRSNIGSTWFLENITDKDSADNDLPNYSKYLFSDNNNSAVFIGFKFSSARGAQLQIASGGLYYRSKLNGAWNAWQTISS